MPKILAFSPSKWCILMHSGARFRPTRPITAIMMFMTSAEVNFFTFKGGGAGARAPLNMPLTTTTTTTTGGRRAFSAPTLCNYTIIGCYPQTLFLCTEVFLAMTYYIN